MKITKHISFYFLMNRIIYINNIIDETNKYEYTTDIFIHTNNIDLHEGMFNNYTNGYIKSVGNMIAPDISLGGTSLITRLAAKQATITDGSLTIARTGGLQTALDTKALIG